MTVPKPDQEADTMPTAPPDSSMCTTCDRPGAALCGGCKNTAYRDKKCQRAEFAVHKLLCTSFC